MLLCGNCCHCFALGKATPTSLNHSSAHSPLRTCSEKPGCSSSLRNAAPADPKQKDLSPRAIPLGASDFPLVRAHCGIRNVERAVAHGLLTLPMWVSDMETEFESTDVVHWTWHHCALEPFLVHTSPKLRIDRSSHCRIRGAFLIFLCLDMDQLRSVHELSDPLSCIQASALLGEAMGELVGLLSHAFHNL